MTSLINSGVASAQPIFHPVAENVLPAEEIRTVRSRIPGKGGQWQVFGVVEGQVLIHLVADDQDIVLHRQLRDRAEIGSIQHRARWDCAVS